MFAGSLVGGWGLQRPLPGVFTEGLTLSPVTSLSQAGASGAYKRGLASVCVSPGFKLEASQLRLLLRADLWEGTGRGAGASTEPDLKSFEPGTN